jgi:hypothetical protein
LVGIQDDAMKRVTQFEFANLAAWRWAAGAAVWALCLTAATGAAQNLPAGGLAVHGVPQPLTQPSSERMDQNPSRPLRDEKLQQAFNADRQKAMVSDTNKLLRLVNELNAEIASKDADSLSPGQLRKVAEIEKLARSVKEKMSAAGKTR